jgi:hypothetical protein
VEVCAESIEADHRLRPLVETEVPCSVRPITPAVEQRLKERHEVHVAEWHENTDKLLRNLRAKFKADGYAPSFMIPAELVETQGAPEKARATADAQPLVPPFDWTRLREISWADPCRSGANGSGSDRCDALPLSLSTQSQTEHRGKLTM